jgi:hypothetical protein
MTAPTSHSGTETRLPYWDLGDRRVPGCFRSASPLLERLDPAAQILDPLMVLFDS